MQMNKKNKIKKELKNHQALVQCAQEFNMIGDPTRLKVCYILCHHQELTVGEIADLVGVSISAVSHTLQKLKEGRVVKDRRDFRHVYYQFRRSPLVTMIKKRLNNL